MKKSLAPSKFQNSTTKCAVEADEQDKLVRIDIGGGALIPIARAERLAGHYLKQNPRYEGPARFQIAIIQTHYHRIVREDLARRKIIFIYRHSKLVGAWISHRAIGDLRIIDAEWVSNYD